MKKYRVKSFVIIVFIIGFFFISIYKNSIILKKEVKIENICYKEVQKEVNGNSMEPLIKEGKKIILLENYYKCNEVQKGDIIAYSFSGNINPIIKKVMVTGEDKVEIKANTLIVNGEILKNSLGMSYNFSPNQINMLNLYINKNRIPKSSFFIFGDNLENSLDSRQFGAVSKNDFIGKFL